MSRAEPGLRIAITGATSLRGKELKEAIESSRLAAAEMRLLDEEIAAGTLTEAGDEPVVVEGVDEDSFVGTRFVFFSGSASFTSRHADAALAAGATLIDMSGGLAARPGARPWIPALDSVLVPPFRTNGAPRSGGIYLSPSAPAQAAISLAAALRRIDARLVSILFLQPVSERGQAGIDELESQTVKLLSLQPIGQGIFDAQVAFNLMDRYGPESQDRLSTAREALARDVAKYLKGRAPLPAVTLLQAPVFYSHGFMAYAEIRSADRLAESLAAAGLKFEAETEAAPTSVGVAGEPRPVLGRPEQDPNAERGWWFWGAADNLRVAAANAVAIAENLLGS